jgi:Bacterial Ig-like domain (group 3)
MKGIPVVRPKRLKRALVLLGAGALFASASVLGTIGTAYAANPTTILGNDGGTLGVNPTTGPTSSSVTLSSNACPAAEQGSAKALIVDPLNSTDTSLLAAVDNSVATAFTITVTGADSLANQESFVSNLDGNTAEIVIECFAQTSGNGTVHAYEQDAFLSFSSDGSTFTVVPPPAAAPTNVSVGLIASPSPATGGQQVTLTATVTPSNATGSIQFQNNGSIIGTAPISGGTASTNTSFSGITTATTETLTAVYQPTGNFAATTPGSFSLTVNPPAPNSGTIPLAVNVPQSGTFTLTVDTTDWVVLGVNTAGTSATAPTTPIVVTDTRNYYPGWSVTGEATQWVGVTNPASETPTGYPAATNIPADHGSQHIAADQLGWAPSNVGTLSPGVTLGPTITAGTSPGLGDAAQVLASVHAGAGNGFTGATGLTLGANLTLAIPAGQEAGPYAADLNIDAASSLP